MEAKEIRARARQSLAGNWVLSIGVAAVALLLGGIISGQSFFPSAKYDIPALQELVEKLNSQIRISESFRVNFRGGIFGLAALILGGVVQLGYCQFLLKQHDGRQPQFNDLFSQFDRFGAGFAQAFLRGLYVFLWTLLLIIPGIVKAYSYSMTPFLMADDPELTASEAIAKSKELMDGHKGELFILDLTFIGWNILCGLTLNLGYIILNPYINAAHAAFYRQLVGNTISA